MKIALLCSGLGNIARGHEVFARGLFDLLKDDADIDLFKGGGEPCARELLVDHVPRNSDCLRHIHAMASPKWAEAIREQERMRVEGETFAYAALKPLLEGRYDVIHCLEQEVCSIIFKNRHLFARTPKVLFSNGGAIPASELPPCDFVQEHTDLNLAHSAKGKSFVLPHGVDLCRFHPGIPSDFRQRHGIPADAFVVISVGTICYEHKRMDHVIREVSRLADAYLIVAGQECADTPAIRALGQELMGRRIVFTTLPHEQLPQAYSAANVFTLGSLFETFGIAYIEAMAMGLPVICTNHPNQRSIVKEGLFVDMKQTGALTDALLHSSTDTFAEMGRRGRQIVEQHYDLAALKQDYLRRYAEIASAPIALPESSWRTRLGANLRNARRWSARLAGGRGGDA
jgi:1,2-diacylglycerol 3-alpha-glucosyltransferase